MFAYAVLGAATVMALYLLFFKKNAATDEEFDITDNLVYVGSSERCGQRRHGDIIGRGTPKRRGRPSHGLHIWYMCITGRFLITSRNSPCGYCSFRLSFCKSAGGVSIICLQFRVPVFMSIPCPRDFSHLIVNPTTKNGQHRCENRLRPFLRERVM